MNFTTVQSEADAEAALRDKGYDVAIHQLESTTEESADEGKQVPAFVYCHVSIGSQAVVEKIRARHKEWRVIRSINGITRLHTGQVTASGVESMLVAINADEACGVEA